MGGRESGSARPVTPPLSGWALVALALLLGVVPAWAQAPPDFFHGLILRRPVIEREVELFVTHTRGPAGENTTAIVALDLPLLPRWQVELTIPGSVAEPADGPSTAGIDDVGVENKVQLLNSARHRAMLSAGLDLRFPTGSAARSAGNTGVAPFVSAGVKLGRLDVLGEVAYQWLFRKDGGSREERLAAGLAAGTAVRPWLTPFVEVVTVSERRGPDEPESSGLLGRMQVYVAPGLQLEVAPGRTILIGVQVPVTGARTLDYAARTALVWDF